MDIANLRILVTGASGCIGIEVIRMLTENYKTKIVAMSRNAEEALSAIKNTFVTTVSGDIRDEELMCKLISETDIVIHLAAKVHHVPVDKVEEREFSQINFEASERIFNISLEKNVKKIVFISTVAVFGNCGEKEFTEEDTCEPQTPYAKSKFEAENVLYNLHKEKGLPMTIIRPVTVFGKNDRGNLLRLIKLMKKGIAMYVGKGSNRKTFIYSSDIAKAIIEVIKNDNTNGKVYIAKGFDITMWEIINKVGKLFNIKLCTISIPQFIMEIVCSICERIASLNRIKFKLSTLASSNLYSGKKLEEDTGFIPDFDFEKGLKDSFEYYS